MIAWPGHDDDGLGDVLGAWALLLASGVAVFVTYTRVPPGELYHVSRSGLAGGAGRALVFANFPLDLVAIPAAAIAAVELRGRIAAAAAAIAIILAAVVFWPGVVKQSDLDARWVNAVGGLGAALALGLTLAAAFRLGFSARRRAPGDDARLVLTAVLLFLAIPWIAADAGYHFDGVRILSSVWQSGELRTQPGQTSLHPAVHLGHHHGLDGTLLALAALVLSRVRLRRLAVPLSLYLALLFAYGIGGVANDFWLEQIVKRGWTDWEIPDVTTPAASWGWLAVGIGAAFVWLVALRPSRSR